MNKSILIFQLIATVLIIAYVPNSLMQVVLLFVLWAITFRTFSAREVILFVLTCVFFTIADIMVISKGVFQFTHTDIWGMPYYEPFVWGFYFLHGTRMLRGRTSEKLTPGLLFALVFVLALSSIPDETVLLTVAGLIVCIALLIFRTKEDFLYTLYFIGIGCAIEFVGTKTGVWYYGIEHYYAWWIVTWGGSGLILYRTIIPVCTYLERQFKIVTKNLY